MPAKSWFTITAAAKDEDDGPVEVAIYDAIGSWDVSARDFINAIKPYSGRDLTVRINSPGGVITEGNAIANALKRHDGDVTTCIDGLAASMATIVAIAGSKVTMAENAYFMVHNPSGSAWGESDDLRKQADLIDKMRAGLLQAYVAKTGMSEQEIGDLMDNETWMTAQEAKDYGFVDEITEPIDAAAEFKPNALAGLGRIPKAILDRFSVDTPAKGMPKATSKFKTLDEALTEITSLTARIAELEPLSTQITALTGEKDKLGKDITALTAERDTLKAEKTGLQTNVTALTAERDTLKAEAKGAHERAIEMLSEMGVTPVSADKKHAGAGSGETVEALWEQYHKLAPEDKAAFYRKHEARACHEFRGEKASLVKRVDGSNGG